MTGNDISYAQTHADRDLKKYRDEVRSEIYASTPGINFDEPAVQSRIEMDALSILFDKAARGKRHFGYVATESMLRMARPVEFQLSDSEVGHVPLFTAISEEMLMVDHIRTLLDASEGSEGVNRDYYLQYARWIDRVAIPLMEMERRDEFYYDEHNFPITVDRLRGVPVDGLASVSNVMKKIQNFSVSFEKGTPEQRDRLLKAWVNPELTFNDIKNGIHAEIMNPEGSEEDDSTHMVSVPDNLESIVMKVERSDRDGSYLIRVNEEGLALLKSVLGDAIELK